MRSHDSQAIRGSARATPNSRVGSPGTARPLSANERVKAWLDAPLYPVTETVATTGESTMPSNGSLTVAGPNPLNAASTITQMSAMATTCFGECLTMPRRLTHSGCRHSVRRQCGTIGPDRLRFIWHDHRIIEAGRDEPNDRSVLCDPSRKDEGLLGA